MNKILQYLKKHGESLDADLAEAVGLSLAEIRIQLTELAAKGEIMAYQSTRFAEGRKNEGIRCRLAGFTPPAAPGRKSS
jgi:predicted ArsR family transcriptional regulator